MVPGRIVRRPEADTGRRLRLRGPSCRRWPRSRTRRRPIRSPTCPTHPKAAMTPIPSRVVCALRPPTRSAAPCAAMQAASNQNDGSGPLRSPIDNPRWSADQLSEWRKTSWPRPMSPAPSAAAVQVPSDPSNACPGDTAGELPRRLSWIHGPSTITSRFEHGTPGTAPTSSHFGTPLLTLRCDGVADGREEAGLRGWRRARLARQGKARRSGVLRREEILEGSPPTDTSRCTRNDTRTWPPTPAVRRRRAGVVRGRPRLACCGPRRRRRGIG